MIVQYFPNHNGDTFAHTSYWQRIPLTAFSVRNSSMYLVMPM